MRKDTRGFMPGPSMEIIEFHFPHLSSTNSYAKEHLSNFQRDKITLISADEQTAGRGRYGGRRWVCPKGEGLLLSFVFFIPEEQQEPLSLTHVLSLSVVEVLKSFGVEGKIKWPNDVLVRGKKIAGILCETVHLPPSFGVVIGIGLNVNMPLETLQEVGQPATSLLDQLGKKVDVGVVKEALIASFSSKLDLFLQKGFAPFQQEFRHYLLFKS